MTTDTPTTGVTMSDIESADESRCVDLLHALSRSCQTRGSYRDAFLDQGEQQATARAIGEHLNHLGGFALMQSVCMSFGESVHGNAVRRMDGQLLTYAWNGVGDWVP
jgi:hypothetical protein